jgi:hypothetical protein
MPIFFMALLSAEEKDRDVARDWFEVVVSLSGSNCRSVSLAFFSKFPGTTSLIAH